VIVRPLSAEDLSILSLENETVAGHTCKVVVLRAGIDADSLRSSIAERLDRAPQLTACLCEVQGERCWVPDPEVDLAEHVVTCANGEPLDGAGLRDEVARLFEQRLDRSRPLWRIDVVPRLADGGSAVIWRIHHALADGSTAMQMANAVLWDEQRDIGGRATRVKRGADAQTRHRLAGLLAAAREAPQPWLRSPFDGDISARRSVALASVDLEGLRLVARAHGGATVNDAALTIVAGAVRRWLEDRHGRLGSVRVKVPVSLHEPVDPDGPDAQPGNRDSFFCVDLPLGSADPLKRLAAIRRATKVRKAGHDAQQLDALMRQLGSVPRLRQFADRVLTHPRSFALNISNVPGPRTPIAVLDVPVKELYSLAEIREHHALRVAAVSLANTLNFGLVADPTILPDVDALARGIEDEAAELVDRLRLV
jgi:Wax ester synthase/diacylglycerol acyltransferase catalytic domain/WS/DGAT C-terminal domain